MKNSTIFQIGHVVYIESPTGVGFSYTIFPNGTITNNMTWNDYATQTLNYNVLKAFFAKYTDLADNPYFITGESYSGVYLPMATAAVIDGINSGDFTNKNLQV